MNRWTAKGQTEIKLKMADPSSVLRTETALIGSLFAHGEQLPDVQAKLEPEEIYSPDCRQIYQLMIDNLRNFGWLPDETTFVMDLARMSMDGEGEVILTGHEFTEVMNWSNAATRHMDPLIDRIKREHRIREATFAAVEMCENLQEPGADIEHVPRSRRRHHVAAGGPGEPFQLLQRLLLLFGGAR